MAKKGFKCILSPPIPAAISSSPSTSMKKGCWIPRHVVVDNQRHIWRVDASSGEIGSDQYPRLKLLEAREDPQPLLLVKACGNARMGQSIRISIFPCVIYWKSKDTVRCRFDCLIIHDIVNVARNRILRRAGRYKNLWLAWKVKWPFVGGNTLHICSFQQPNFSQSRTLEGLLGWNGPLQGTWTSPCTSL